MLPKTATLQCEDRKVVLEARCVDLYGPNMLACTSQRLTVFDSATGKMLKVREFAAEKADGDDPAIVAEQFSDITCVRTKSDEKYIVATMANGGKRRQLRRMRMGGCLQLGRRTAGLRRRQAQKGDRHRRGSQGRVRQTGEPHWQDRAAGLLLCRAAIRAHKRKKAQESARRRNKAQESARRRKGRVHRAPVVAGLIVR